MPSSTPLQNSAMNRFTTAFLGLILSGTMLWILKVRGVPDVRNSFFLILLNTYFGVREISRLRKI